MVRTPDSLEAQLLKLPPADRARLAEVLLASLDSEERGSPEETETAWASEAERRLRELREGTVAGIPVDEVFDAIDRRLKG